MILLYGCFVKGLLQAGEFQVKATLVHKGTLCCARETEFRHFGDGQVAGTAPETNPVRVL